MAALSGDVRGSYLAELECLYLLTDCYRWTYDRSHEDRKGDVSGCSDCFSKAHVPVVCLAVVPETRKVGFVALSNHTAEEYCTSHAKIVINSL